MKEKTEKVDINKFNEIGNVIGKIPTDVNKAIDRALLFTCIFVPVVSAGFILASIYLGFWN